MRQGLNYLNPQKLFNPLKFGGWEFFAGWLWLYEVVISQEARAALPFACDSWAGRHSVPRSVAALLSEKPCWVPCSRSPWAARVPHGCGCVRQPRLAPAAPGLCPVLSSSFPRS